MKTRNLKSSLLTIATIAAVAFAAGNVAAQDSTATVQPAPQLSYGVPQVVQLVQAKVSDGIIVSYIQNSGTIYSLKAGEIVYLKQQGVSDSVLSAMLNQRSRLTGSTEPATTTASAPAVNDQTSTAAAPAVSYVQSVPSSTVYVIPDTQTYQYDAWYYGGYPYGYYPYYGGYYGWPAVSLSFGWGGHYGGGWHGGGGYHGGGGFHGGGGHRWFFARVSGFSDQSSVWPRMGGPLPACHQIVTCHHLSAAYLCPMNPADLFSHETDTLNLAPGDTLFKAGDPGDAMFVLLEGEMDVVVGDRVVEHSACGAIIGEMAIIDQSPRGATVIARERSRLAKIDQRRFLHLIQLNPFFATHVMKVLTDRLRQMNQLAGQKPNS